jgi:hypothetical protein
MAVLYFEGKKGFPPIDPIFDGRYRPAVRERLDKRWNMGSPGLPGLEGVGHPELWNVRRGRRTRSD